MRRIIHRRSVLRALWLSAIGLLAIVGVWLMPGRVAPDYQPYRVVHFEGKQQKDSVRPRFVIMDDYVREYLAAEWDKHKTDSLQIERGYCIRWQYDIWARELAYRVTQIDTAETIAADPSSIDFICPTSRNMAEIHIHPATTCIKGYCWNEGPYARQCAPSDEDRKYLIWAGQPFGMVQCDTRAFVYYFPMGDNR